MKNLVIGRSNEEEIVLSTTTLQRHLACFGSSGSGKTVACKVAIEEMTRNGIPIIAFDPQGDIASLAITEEASIIEGKGTSPQILESYKENVEVVIWTPASSKGVPICINPLQFEGVEDMSAEDQLRFLSATAKNIASLLGYDIGGDDGKAVEVTLSSIFEYCIDNKINLSGFRDVINILDELPESIASSVNSICSSRDLKELSKKLNLLTMGARKLLFETGTPINIDMLLGLKRPNGKTRLSVIYLNTLHTSEEKEFFVSTITQQLYNWMLKNPLKDDKRALQCGLFIDEVAPYIPPSNVKKPACKDSLVLLFRQARKYGICCIAASQSPGDLDYKAMGQYSNILLGSLYTPQDIKKVHQRIESIVPNEAESIVQQLSSLKKGQFVLLSPDQYKEVKKTNIRWLVTKHPLTLAEDDLEQYISDSIKLEIQSYAQISEDEGAPKDEEDLNRNQKGKARSVKEKPNSSDILVVKNIVFERDLPKKVRPELEGTFFKSENLIDTKSAYYPLIKVNLTFTKEKGFFKKTRESFVENLYIDYKTEDLVYVEKNHFKFSNIIEEDPNEIVDLDEFCTFSSENKDEVDYDFRQLGKKLNESSIKRSMEKKYPIEVHSSQLVLFPVWKCDIQNKKKKTKRHIYLDGVFGNLLQIKE